MLNAFEISCHNQMPPGSNELWWMRYVFQVLRVFASVHKGFRLRTEHPILLARDILVVLKTGYQYVSLRISCTTTAPDSKDLVALLPYTIFSLFHALTFTRTTVIPQFLPPGPPATAGGPPQAHPVARKLQVWVKCALASFGTINWHYSLIPFRFPSQL